MLNKTEPIDTTKFYDLDQGKVFYDSPSPEPGDESISVGPPALNELELMEMYHQADRVLYKAPRNFDINSTHHSRIPLNIASSDARHTHVMLPKKQKVKSVNRPKTTGILSQ